MTRRSQRSKFPAGSINYFPEGLSRAEGLQDIFELVKEAVWKTQRKDQAGLLLGLSKMGISAKRILGAYYSPDANAIVINKTVMERVMQLNDFGLYNAYCFYVILHEYLHSCGFYDEQENQKMVVGITLELFGQEHQVTKLAVEKDAMVRLLQPGTLTPDYIESIQPDGMEDIEFVAGIDRSNTNYIS
jgi:hypothetical protein